MNFSQFRHPLFVLALFGAGLFAAAPALATTGNWNITGSGNWNVNGNWTANFPNAAGETARLTNNITSNTTVTIPTGIGITVGTINIGDSTGGTFNSFNVTAAGTGNLTLDVTSGNGTIRKVSTASTVNDTISAPIKLADSLDLINLNTNSALVISGNITELSAGLGVAKSGSGLVTLSGTNSYTGTTNVTAGTLNITKTLALYNNTPGSWTSTNINVSGAATMQLSVGGSGEFGSADVGILAGLSGSGGFANGSFLALNTTTNTTISDNLVNANTVGLIKLGSSTLTLSGANNYGGTTQILAGTVQFATTASLYNSTLPPDTHLIVSSGATAAFNVGGGGEFSASDFVTLAGLGTGSGGFLDGSNITIDTSNAGGDVTISSPISNVNNVAFTKAGTNNLILASTVNFTADTNLTGGGIILADENALAASRLVISAGTTVAFSDTVGSHNFNIGSFINSSAIDTHSVSLQDNSSNPVTLHVLQGGTYNGKLTGSGSIVKEGASTWALAGTNDYTGSTTVNSGALRFNVATAISGLAQQVTVNAGGTMSTGFNIDQPTLNKVSSASTGVVAINTAGTINLDFSASGANLPDVSFGATGTRNYSGVITPFNGIYRLGGGGGTLNVSAASFLTGTGNSLVLDNHGTGNSTVVLNGAATYDGGTTLNSGITVGIGNNDALGVSTGSVNMNGGTINTVGSGNFSVANPLFNNGVTTRVVVQASTLNFSGPLTGTGTILVDTGAADTSHAGTVNFSGSLSGFDGLFEHYAYDTTGPGTGSAQAMTLRFSQAPVSGVQDLSGVRLLTHGVYNNASSGRSVRLGDGNGTATGVVKTILGELNGDGGNIIAHLNGGTKQVVEVGALETLSSFAGGFRELVFMDFVKIGSNVQTLSGTSSYGGTTTVRSGTLIMGHDTLSTRLSPRGSVEGNVADTGNLFATTGSVNGTNNTINYTANTAAAGFTPLVNGQRVMFGNVGFGPTSSTEYYVVNAGTTNFKISTTNGGTALAMTTNAAMTFYPVGAFGASDTAVELGDTGAATMHTATTNSETVALMIGGAFTLGRPVNVNDVGAGSMIGGTTNNNSTFSGAINLYKNVTVAQSATTGTRAVHLTGAISSATSGTKTITFGATGLLGTTSVETTGIHDGSGNVNVTIEGNATVLGAPSTFTGGTTLNSGVVLVAHDNAFGAGNVVLNNGTVSTFGTGNVTHTVANPILVNNNIKFSATVSSTGTNNNVTYSGPITGTGNIQVDSQTPNAAGTSAQVAFSGDLSGYLGTIEHFAYDTTGGGGAGSAVANTLRFMQPTVSNVQDLSALRLVTHGFTNFGSNGRSVRLGDGNSTETGNVVSRIGELSGDGGLIITDITASTANRQIVEVGSSNNSTTWAGAWRENRFMDFVKVGTGNFTTTGQNAYSGTTFIRSGALILGRDAVSTVLSNRGTIEGDGIGGLFDNNMSVDGTTNTISYTANTSAAAFVPYADGDRLLMGWGTSPGGVSATTEYYVIGATPTSFKISETLNGAEVDLGTTTPSSFRGYKIGSLGTTNTTVELGDDGLSDMHTATSNSETVALFIGGAFTVDRPIKVNNVGAGSTLGGNTDNNSTFKGAITLYKDVTIAQSATTNGNQLHVTGGISSGGGAETASFATTGYLGDIIVETTGISDGAGAVSVAIDGNTTTFTAPNTYSGTTNVNSGTLYLNTTHTGAGQYTVGGGATLAGTGTIDGPGVALDNGSFISPGAPSGTFTINGLLSTTGAVATENGAGDLIVSGGLSVSAGGSLDKTGAGILDVSGAQSNGAGSTLNASNGSVILNSDAGSAGNLNMNLVADGAATTVELNDTQHLASLSATSNALVTLTAPPAAYTTPGYTPGTTHITTDNLAIDYANGATVDLGNGSMIVNYTGGGPNPALLASITGMAANASNVANFSSWDLPGLTSSVAAADYFSTGALGVGVVDNNDLLNIALGYAYDGITGAQFNAAATGEAVSPDAILVKVTYYGDSDLNGVTDITDYALFLAGYTDPTNNPANWMNGDYDYSGTVDITDYSYFLAGYSATTTYGNVLSGGGPVAVPEPSSILLLVLGGVALGWHVRRGKQKQTNESMN